MEDLEKRRAAAPTVPPRPRALVSMHWLTLVPLLLAFAAVLCREQLEDRTLRAVLLSVHQWSGASVLALGLARLLVRWRLGRLPPSMAPHWSNGLATAVHVALYAALLAVPLLGWASVTAAGKVPPWGLALPAAWIAEDEDLAEQLLSAHQSAAYAAAAVIALHVLAAMWHHFVRRDGVLRAMRLQRAPGVQVRPRRKTN